MTQAKADGGRTDERAKVLFGLLVDDVDRRMNPNDDECWHCGGEGYVADCFDGFCVDAEGGCEECTRRCPECARYSYNRLKAIREEVIKSGDVDIAREWLRSVGRWSDDISTEQITQHLEDARVALSSSRSDQQ